MVDYLFAGSQALPIGTGAVGSNVTATAIGLRSLSPVALIGSSIVADGYAAQGDGGGGTFVWNNADVRPDDGGLIFKYASLATGRWNRVVSHVYSVRWWGAKGDGVADDTTAIRAAVSAKESAPASAGVATIYIPAGYYKVTGSIDFGSRACIVCGDGWGFHGLGDFVSAVNSHGSILASNIASGNAFTVGDTGDTSIVQLGIKLRDLAFVSSTWNPSPMPPLVPPHGVPVTTAVGLSIRPVSGAPCTNVTIDNVHVAGFAVGFDPGITEEGTFKDLACWSNGIGLRSGAGGSTNCSWLNVQLNANDVGAKLISSAQWQFFGGLVQSNFSIGLLFQPVTDLLEHSFRGLWFENNNSSATPNCGDIVYDLVNETPAAPIFVAQTSFLRCHLGGGANALLRPVVFLRNAGGHNASTYVQIKFDGCYALGESLALPSYSILSAVIDTELGGVFTDAGFATTVLGSRVAGIVIPAQFGQLTAVAMGGGAAPTLGTIGGSGPAAAAQNCWVKMIDTAGNPFWLPAWR